MPSFHTSLGEGGEAGRKLAGWPLLPLRQTSKVKKNVVTETAVGIEPQKKLVKNKRQISFVRIPSSI
jgi:hypothetical protein